MGTASANSVESDLGCTPRIYFDNVTLTLYNVTLTSLKPCQHNNKCEWFNEVNVFFTKILLYFIEKYINFIYSSD